LNHESIFIRKAERKRPVVPLVIYGVVDRLKMGWRSQKRSVCGWGCEGVTWRVLAKTVMNLRRLWKKEHLLSILATVTFWITTTHR